MTPINFPKLPNTLFRSSTIVFHFINYFNMTVRMNRVPFLAITIGLSFLFTPVLAYIIPEAAFENPETMFDNLTRGQAIVIEAYGLLILPAFLKRMKDADFSVLRIEIVLAMIYGTAIIHAFVSDTTINAITPILGLMNLVIAILMIALVFIAGTKGENQYGLAPTKTRAEH
jgi:uncharacterized membrane protein YhaH (DUF805 family)